MVRVWLPRLVADAFGEAPKGAMLEPYDGGGDEGSDVHGTPDVEEAEFLVPPFPDPSPAFPLLESLPRLRVVQTVTAGVEAVRPYVPDGVTLCNARGVHDASTAEWTVGAILASLHKFPRFARAAAESRWDWDWTDSLADKTVLIVGYGSIGAAVERRLAGFEIDILRVARGAREDVAPVSALPELLPRADVVVLLVPFTEETRGMVGADFLHRMGDGALLVNAARGPVVDTAALVRELTAGRLRAALDVTDPEPLPADHPLWRAPGLLLTPHVAGSTPASTSRAIGLLRTQVERYVAGGPLHNVVTGAY